MPLCKFSLDWLNAALHPDWVPWLAASKSVDTNALCKICKKEFSLSNMGVQAAKSHSKKKKKNTLLCSIVANLLLPLTPLHDNLISIHVL